NGQFAAGEVGLHAGVEEAFAETVCLLATVHEQAMLAHARRAEIIALAADGKHQVVIVQGTLRQDFLAVLATQWCQGNGLLLRVDRGHGAEHEAIVIQSCMGAVIHGVEIGIDGAGGDFMEARLPYMEGIVVDQRDIGTTVPAKLAAKQGDQRQTTGAAAYNKDSGFCHGLPPGLREARSLASQSATSSLDWPVCPVHMAGYTCISGAVASGMTTRHDTYLDGRQRA